MTKPKIKNQNEKSKEVNDSLPGTTKHMVIPDCQVRPGVDLSHLEWAGNYIAEKHPNYVHNIGDFNDMNSLNSHASVKELEMKRYREDIEYGKEAMATLMRPILKEKARLKRRGLIWNPKLEMYLGNHENRINRAIKANPSILEGTISTQDLGYDSFGWVVHDFLVPVDHCGIIFSHYFISGIMGKPVTSARALVQKKHQSCIMGHVQQRAVHYEYTASGHKITGIFAGVFYSHDEDYLGPQGNQVERGIWTLYNVRSGDFNEQYVPLAYLKHKYS